jgi:TrmH family RNA methyltransferase
MGLSKSQIKLISSLQQKKYRVKNGLFVAEGIKVVKELLNSNLELAQLFLVEGAEVIFEDVSFQVVSENELKKVSSLKTPNDVLALFKIPEAKEIISDGLVLALDELNDPGNLGTIIRLCDWFGISQLVCSKNTVDCYNSKVVQSSMGSLPRVQINYCDLASYLEFNTSKKYIADMNGEVVYDAAIPKNGVLIMGNEANGISEQIRAANYNKLTIPRFGEMQATESLNVATATAILLSEFKRR